MRTIFLIAATAGLLTTAPALAQDKPTAAASVGALPDGQNETIDPARLAAARKLIAKMDYDATLDRMFVALAPVFADGVIGVMSSDPTTKPAINNLIANGDGGHDRLVAILSQEFLAAIKKRYPELKEHAAREYAADFSADELDQISAFYSSGVGAKVLRLLPQIQQKLAAAGEKLGEKAGAEAGAKAFDRAEKEMLHKTVQPKI